MTTKNDDNQEPDSTPQDGDGSADTPCSDKPKKRPRPDHYITYDLKNMSREDMAKALLDCCRKIAHMGDQIQELKSTR